MNERIKQLAEQATEKYTTYFDGRGNVTESYFNKERFAELIVRECAQVCDNLQDVPATEPRHCAEDIRIHFGVGE